MKKLIKYLSAAVLLVSIISCEKEVYDGTVVEPQIENSKIIIRSNPSGTKIYLDNKNMGISTPDSLLYLSSGDHKITLKHELLKDTTIFINIENGTTKSLDIDYYKNPGHFGTILCNSTPQGAEVFLNGNAAGFYTPGKISNLFPGNYTVKFIKAMHRSDSIIVTVKGGKTSTAFIALEDTSKWVKYTTLNSAISSDHLSCVAVDQKNIKWIGTRDRGLARLEGNKLTVFRQANSPLIYDFINALAVGKNNVLWIATSGGLMSYDGITWRNFTSSLPSSYVTSIAVDKSGNIWAGTMQGLVKYDGVSWKIFNSSNSGLAWNFVTTVSADQNNKIWFGTSANGIGSFDGSVWQVFNMANMGLNINVGNAIKSISVDKNGIVWAAHVENFLIGELGGFTQFNGTKWSIVNLRGVPSSQIEKIYVDENNIKWVGTKSGMGKFSQPADIVTFTTANSQLPASQVADIAIDANGDLWIATFGGGLARLKKGNF